MLVALCFMNICILFTTSILAHRWFNPGLSNTFAIINHMSDWWQMENLSWECYGYFDTFCCLPLWYVPHKDWLPLEHHLSYSSSSMLWSIWTQLVHSIIRLNNLSNNVLRITINDEKLDLKILGNVEGRPLVLFNRYEHPCFERVTFLF